MTTLPTPHRPVSPNPQPGKSNSNSGFKKQYHHLVLSKKEITKLGKEDLIKGGDVLSPNRYSKGKYDLNIPTKNSDHINEILSKLYFLEHDVTSGSYIWVILCMFPFVIGLILASK